MNNLSALSKLSALFLLIGLLLAGQASGDTRYRDEIFKISKKKDVVYGTGAIGAYGETEELKLDLFKPKGDEVKKRPAVVWVHGGGFARGSKGFGPAPKLAKHFARMGYVTVSIDYRLLAPNSCDGANGVTAECFAAAIEGTHDAQAAVRWLRANAKGLRIDKKRIGIGGESAGAIISCGVAVLSADPGTSGNPGFSSEVGGFVSISGGLPGGIFVDQNTAPGILFASTGDPVVPYEWSVQTRDVMQSFGIPAKLVSFDSNVHVPWDDHRAEIEKGAAKTLYKYLDLAGAKG